MELALKDKVALVTASSKGLGFATAKMMLEEGAKVAINSRSEESLQQAVESLDPSLRENVFPVVADLTNPESLQNMLDNILDHYGKIDILVCNTGGPKKADYMDTSLLDWQEALELMFFPVLQMTQRVIPLMKQNGGGRIIFLTSTWVKQIGRAHV